MSNSAYIRTQGCGIKSQTIEPFIWRYTMSNKKFESRRLVKKRKRSQRIWLFLMFGGVVLIGVAFLIFRANQNTQPAAAIEVNGAASLKADKEKVDLGNVQLGQTVQVSFNLTNVGDQTLKFSAAPYVEVVEGC
jgi:cell division septal protein FtsQ